MKKIGLMMLTLVTFLGFNASAQGIKFETGTLKESLAKAAKEDKLVFMDIYATWCGPCVRMAKDVFPQKSVGDYFNKNFINTKFDAEKGEGVSIAQRYRVRAYPTFLLLNSKGEVVGTKVGGASPEDFVKKFKELKEKALK